jgi:glucans biosynthesis protein C
MEASRRPDIDWLRVGAVYLLFVFHVGKVFDPAPFYHIRNADLCFAMLVVCGFISLWHMPLFFLLAGWSAAASLQARGRRRFVSERMRKLAVPLIAGSVLLGPPIKYLELSSGLDLNHAGLWVAAPLQSGFRTVIPTGLPVAPPFDDSFLTFLPTFFTRLDRFTWAHLWFLAYLFTFTVVYLPAFHALLRSQGRLQTARAWIVYAPIVPLAVIQLALRPYWPGIQNLYDDWANVAYYSVYLLAGFFLACHPALEGIVQREWKRSLALGLGAMTVLLLAVLGVTNAPAVLLVGSAVAGWCFVVALLGFAQRYLTASGPVLHYLSESAFPVYVLHQAAIVIPGYFLVRLPMGIAAKFALLVLVSVALTLAVYQWLVRPFGVSRFLLGMKPKACPIRRPAVLAPSAVAMLLAALGVALPARSVAATPVGLWYAEGGAAQVAIEKCDKALCGRVVWLRSPFDDDGCDLRDRNNPDSTLRRRKVTGLEILRDLRPQADGTWVDGTIYDPASGNTYTCRLTLDGDNRLWLRGYIGIPLLGRTATWTRVGAENHMCREDDR